jgi:hypothetical protein
MLHKQALSRVPAWSILVAEPKRNGEWEGESKGGEVEGKGCANDSERSRRVGQGAKQ